ncbi:hypothetical protein [Pseudonocardia sp. ICBG601]|uniref:hypothetical protein n=1 Tax=Pseudonocardia sp. ICBG601 TaxID=2846759 RepID=UPI001CF615CB|nr:hypothetical protein [Pseudonocardia sp. ICBG601]
MTVDVVVADLNRAELRATLLTGATVGERSSVPAHAQRGGAAAAINGDFFDLGRSNAPAGPSVRDGRALTSAVPPGGGSPRASPAPSRATCSPSTTTAPAPGPAHPRRLRDRPAGPPPDRHPQRLRRARRRDRAVHLRLGG